MTGWQHRVLVPGLVLLCLRAGLARADEPDVSFAARQADKPLVVRLGQDVVLTPYYLTDLDQAGFGESRAGGQAAGLNLRRQQLGGEVDIGRAVSFGAVWDFGSSPGGRGRLLEGQVSLTALRPVVASVGVFKPQFSLESVQNGGDTALMERASIVNVTRGLAASSGREAAQILGAGPRWLAAAALTAGITGTSGDGGQRAVVGRALVLPVRTDTLTLELGGSGQRVWHPPNRDGTGPAVSFSNTVELAVDDPGPSVDTKRIAARSATVAGVEASLSWRDLLLQGEYYGIGVSRAGGGPDLRFGGWYLQSTYTVFGSPRRWDGGQGVWAPTAGTGEFSPSRGHWGTLQATLRFSTLDLNAADVRGGRQNAWTAGLSYWPVLSVRLLAEYVHADVSGRPAPRRTNGVGGRLQLQF